MRVSEDGSVTLNPDEAKAVAKLLELGRELCEQLDSSHQGSETVEYNLLAVIDLLEDLGVSSDEMTEKLDSGQIHR